MGSKWNLVILQLYIVAELIHPCQSWDVMGEGFEYVAVGPQGVWGLKSFEEGGVQYRTGTADNPGNLGSAWEDVAGEIRQLDVGSNVIWGVNSKDWLYRKLLDESAVHQGTAWVLIHTANLRRASVSSINHMWGIDLDGNAVRRVDASLATPWGNELETITDEKLSEISVGGAGVWAITEAGKVVYREGTYGDVDTSGTSWTEVPGEMKSLSSDVGVLFGISNDDEIFYRSGMSESAPTGTEWVQLEGSLKQIDSWNGILWGVNDQNQVLVKVMDCPPTTK